MMINSKKVRLGLALFLSALLATTAHAYTDDVTDGAEEITNGVIEDIYGDLDECQTMEVTLENRSNFTWLLDEEKTSNLDRYPGPTVIPPHTTLTFPFSSISNFDDAAEQTYHFKVNTEANPGGANYHFAFRVKYDICIPGDRYCTNIGSDGRIDADANVASDPGHHLHLDWVDDGASGGCFVCSGSGWDTRCYTTSPDEGNAWFIIRQPSGFGLKIQYPQDNVTAPTLKNQAFLQQVYNNLKPSIIRHFDSLFGHPARYQDDSAEFNFTLPCSNHACVCYIDPSLDVC